MTVVAIWCRHVEDNLIGIGGNIPWHIPSDLKRFYDIVNEQTVVCGRKTYESFPNRTIEGSQIFVMTSNPDYEVSNIDNHHVIHSQKELADFREDIFVVGGAEIYSLFMTGKECLKPQIVIDCVYKGKVDEKAGERVTIDDAVAILEKKYRKISLDYIKDEVECALYVRKGEFVEQSVLKRLLLILEQSV